ncbi:MAG TPA: hypothetical protein VFY03_04190 [Woeseiaceae bacterium]|nr:hypothetical protein [Woeseiaceae bacterium]
MPTCLLRLPFTGLASALACALACSACTRDDAAAETGATAVAATAVAATAVAGTGLLPPAAAPRACPDGGRLTATLYGALEGEIDWRAADMSCEGMPRPAGAGARLRFAGAAGGGGVELAIIIAVPGLERGVAGTDLPSNVTLIEEGRGRFFSTTALDYCWVDIDRSEELEGRPAHTLVGGTLSCIAPLAETNGDTSVTIDGLIFSGVVDWSAG